ncbi:hypothetical protein B1M_05066 [Burkholderia sp. TJI49]|nr:hypothetical protein B1M_05066 [Burkholderia sp. TJI49]
MARLMPRARYFEMYQSASVLARDGDFVAAGG